MLLVPVMAQDYGLTGNRGIDVLGTGIFKTERSVFKISSTQNANLNNLDVGNDMAVAFGNMWGKSSLTTALNNLDIVKSQDSGSCCQIPDCYINFNMEQIKVGNRSALAFGLASATNNIMIHSSDIIHKIHNTPDWLPNI